MPITSEQAALVRQHLDGALANNQQVGTVHFFLIGQQYVGKRSLARRFAWGEFIDFDSTDDFIYKKHKTIIPGKPDLLIRLHAWTVDSVEQPLLDWNTTTEYLRTPGDVCMFMYDVGRRETFERLESLCKEVMEARMGGGGGAGGGGAGGGAGGKGTLPLYVVAHKADRTDWAVSQDEGEAFSARIGAEFCLMSAKTGVGFGDDVFVDIACRAILGRLKH